MIEKNILILQKVGGGGLKPLPAGYTTYYSQIVHGSISLTAVRRGACENCEKGARPIKTLLLTCFQKTDLEQIQSRFLNETGRNVQYQIVLTALGVLNEIDPIYI